ncbi:MAG TPA: ion channel [Bacteroidota bacterium]|nr:ion channel [Bacteroidota bacterium]
MRHDLATAFSQTVKLFRKNQLAQLSVVIVLTITVAAFFMLLSESRENSRQFQTFGDALWWSIVTVATVGYGDKVPITTAGRIVGSATIIGGLILISLFTATISSVFVARKIKESQGLQDIDFTGHTLICGWNAHVEEILRILNRYSSASSQMKVVLANEAQPELMEVVSEAYPNLEVKFVRGDYSREPVLNRTNVKAAYAALLVPDTTSKEGQLSDDKTLLALLTMKSLNPKLKVFAHIINKENYQHVKRANADDVIVSDQHVGFFLANQILYPGAPQVAMEILDYEYGNDIHRVAIPEQFVEKTFEQLFLHFKKTKNWTLIGIVTEEETVSLNDILSHDMSAVDTFIERKFKEAGINVAERMGMRVDVNPPFDYVIQKKDLGIIIGTIDNDKS